MANKYPIVTLTGPRQSGKSTLLRNSFQDYEYVSLEDPDMRLFATDDPRGFLSTYPDKTIIDEVQRVPSLFSYIQTHTDKENKEGMYMLAGSHNFLLMESVNQSLAGRTAVLKLLPFSHYEMEKGEILPSSVNEEIFKGMTSVGNNPTVNGIDLTIETYILDFNENIYNKEIKLYFIDKIRDEIKFNNIDELVNQLKKDKKYVETKNIAICQKNL